jgi:hypothetical protein
MSGARADHRLDAALDEASGVFVARAAPLGPPTDAQRELILQHVVDPTVLDEGRELVTWQVTASNSNLDSYYTRMHESSLRNFAQDAIDGLSFMDSHHTGGFAMGPPEQPLGHSFDGRYVGPSGAGPARVEESFYAFRGQQPNGPMKLSVDELLFSMRAGTSRDISIGFIPGEFRCSIDGLNWLRDMNCPHWPGMTYPKLDSKGNDTGETQLAFLWVYDAHQTEASAVYDGATPGCMVSKARRMAEEGHIRADVIDLLEQRYRIKLPHPARSLVGAAIPPPEEDAMPQDGITPGGISPEDLASVRLALTELGIKPDAALPESVRSIVDELKAARGHAAEVERLKPFEDEVARLRPLADEGRQYRADLVKDALAEGVRAYGAGFAEETYRGLLESAPLETVKRMAEDWKAIGDKQFPGGRLTRDVDETTRNGAAGPDGLPDAAFRTR